ncbi:S-layer homology domain-containing protein [Indiicoccus explosivorum]|uniref:S-layer homology domain-containing protein n=1 Tax=Indiicoccus explosivorum TaxID=1917864 RepID=UPI000B44933F|nr:S-layer homology domain-containing protein [Indiicoccus explosivorum]
MKKLLSSAAAACLVLFAFIASPASAVVSFDDVPPSYRFYEEIVYLHAEGVIDGFEDGTFRPNSTVTRGQAAKFIGDALGLDGTQRGTDFSDVAAGNTFSGYIQSAAEAGIISGYPDGTFRPHEPVERQHVALMLAKAFDFPQVLDEDFTDVGPNMEAYEAIAILANFGVAQGYPDGTFRPEQDVTRGQFAAFLARAYEPYFIPEKAALLETSNDILQHLKDQDFEAVAEYVGSEGLSFCPFAGGCADGDGVTMAKGQVRNFMEITTEYLWGYEAGSGFEINLTPAEYYDKYLLDAPYEEKTMYGNSGDSMSRELIRERYPEAVIIEYYYPGTEANSYMDWQSLSMVFEEQANGDWTLLALVNDRWTP